MKAFQSPRKYIQHKGALTKVGNHVRTVYPQLQKSGIIMPEHLVSKYKHSLSETLKDYIVYTFDGECTYDNAQQILMEFHEQHVDHVVAFGGGKILDIGKLVAYHLKTPSVIIPSLASTDAPCTALSVIYKNNGEFQEYKFFETNPDIVIVDTQVIAEAPSRYLVAGMGDAMSTYYEAAACVRNSNAMNIIYPFIYRPSQISLAISKQCLDILYEHGVSAKNSCLMKETSESLDYIIEANILMSGLGAESGGLAMAHGLHNALTNFEETHKYLHGEKVAFGTIVQLVAEQNISEAVRVAKFNASVGLPTTLKDIGFTMNTPNDVIHKLAALCLEKDNTCWNVGPMTREYVANCIVTANNLLL